MELWVTLLTSLIEPEPTSAVSLQVNVDSRVADPLAWDFANLSSTCTTTLRHEHLRQFG